MKIGTVPNPLPDIKSAGAVVLRKSGSGGRQVLLVHRPKYDDWSFPKGKVDRGEHVVAAAVREVHEETGVHIRLGVPLPAQRYPLTRRMKLVHYWVGHVVGSDDISNYWPNKEIDDLAWVDLDKAEHLLTYPFDRDTLAAAVAQRKRTRALIVLRHAVARSRRAWRVDDTLRPLLKLGERQADKLVPLLAAYDVSRVVSSSSTRCLQTVAPFSHVVRQRIQPHKGLSEEKATSATVTRVVDTLLQATENGVLCGHRPVLPSIFDALEIDDVKLPPAGFVVVHHRRGRVVATEQHGVR